MSVYILCVCVQAWFIELIYTFALAYVILTVRMPVHVGPSVFARLLLLFV